MPQMPKDAIAPLQHFTILASAIIGSGIFTLPRELADVAREDLWLTLILTAAALLLVTCLAIDTARRFPGDTFVEYCQRLLGPGFGKALAWLFLLYMVFVTGMETRRFGVAVKYFLLERTPLDFIAISALITAVFAARSGVNTLGRLNTLWFWPTVGLTGFMFAALYTERFDFNELKPVLDQGIGPVARGVATAWFSFSGPEVLTGLLFPFLIRPQAARKASALAILFSLGVYLLICIACLGLFGVEHLHYLIYPTVSALRSVEIPGIFVERLDALLVIVWVPIMVRVLAIWLYFGGLAVSRLASLEEMRATAVFLLPPAFFLSTVAPDAPGSFALIRGVGMAGLILSFTVLPGIWLLARVKGEKACVRQ